MGRLLAPTAGAKQNNFVRVIALSTLLSFARNRVEQNLQEGIQAHLDVWHADVRRASWKNSAELKQRYRSANVLSAKRVVSNIRGNHYRLIVAIEYKYQVLLIKWLGTHKEYDKIDAREVEYDEYRYISSPDLDKAGSQGGSGTNQ